MSLLIKPHLLLSAWAEGRGGTGVGLTDGMLVTTRHNIAVRNQETEREQVTAPWSTGGNTDYMTDLGNKSQQLFTPTTIWL